MQVLIATARRALIAATVVLGVVPSVGAEPLVIGSVAKDVRKELRQVEPLAQYLGARLVSAGVDRVEALVLPNAAQMAEAIRAGRVHLYLESPYVAAVVGAQSGGVPFLRRWKKGFGEYWSEIVVRQDSPIRTMADLAGRVIAFEDPDSTSGHLLPRATLLEEGLDVQPLAHLDDKPGAGGVGSVFSMDDRTSILWLLAGRVDAIATDPDYARRLERDQPGRTRTIARSKTVPRHVVMHGPTMSPELSSRIAVVLSGMHESDEGRKTLASIGADRFDAFPAGLAATFRPIHEHLRLLEPALGGGVTSSPFTPKPTIGSDASVGVN